MKTVFEGEKCRSDMVTFTSTQPCIGPRKFHCGFPRFRSAVGEEYAIEPRHLREPHCEFGLTLVKIQIRCVNQLLTLARNRIQDCGMPVSKRIYANAAKQVEILHTASSMR